MRWVIHDLLVEFGMGIIKTKYGKKLKDYSLYELIIPYNGIHHRILFCIISNTAWSLHAFGKKSNHTPKKEIKTALNRQNF
jgi:phage-related protein